MTKHKSEDYKLTAVKYFLENNDTNYTKTYRGEERNEKE